MNNPLMIYTYISDTVMKINELPAHKVTKINVKSTVLYENSKLKKKNSKRAKLINVLLMHTNIHGKI